MSIPRPRTATKQNKHMVCIHARTLAWLSSTSPCTRGSSSSRSCSISPMSFDTGASVMSAQLLNCVFWGGGEDQEVSNTVVDVCANVIISYPPITHICIHTYDDGLPQLDAVLHVAHGGAVVDDGRRRRARYVHKLPRPTLLGDFVPKVVRRDVFLWWRYAGRWVLGWAAASSVVPVLK